MTNATATTPTTSPHHRVVWVDTDRTPKRTCALGTSLAFAVLDDLHADGFRAHLEQLDRAGRWIAVGDAGSAADDRAPHAATPVEHRDPPTVVSRRTTL